MTTIAVYLFFIGSLSGYRSSKYWPKEITAISWLGKYWWQWGSVLLGSALLVFDKGWTIGILSALCVYMALLSCLIFTVACNRQIRLLVLILFHFLCFFGLILKF